MARDFPKKLRLTLEALNCRTQKELLAKLLKVNPDTKFTPDRAYKWLGGAALPRDASVYADLADTLGLEGGGGFFKDATLPEFRARLLHNFPEIAATDETPTNHDDTHLLVPDNLAGLYACFSPAWSVTKPDQIISGTLKLTPSGSRYHATYCEVHGSTRHCYSGDLFLRDTSMYGMLLPERGDLSVYLCLNRPSRAGLVLGGIFAGAALNDPFTRPCASCMCCLAFPAQDERAFELETYIPDLDSLTNALMNLGFQRNTEAVSSLAEALSKVFQGTKASAVVDLRIEDTVNIETLVFQAQERLPS